LVHVVFILALQVLVVLLIGYTSLRKRFNLKNQLLLLALLILSLFYTSVMRPFSPAEEQFIMIAALFVLPVVGFMVLAIIIFARKSAHPEVIRNRTYLNEVQRKAFHFIALPMFVPLEYYREIYNLVLDGAYFTFGLFIEKRSMGYLCFLLFTVVLLLLVLFSLIEFLRLNFKPVLFGSLLREKELNQLASYFYSTVSVYLVTLFFFPNDRVVVAAIAIGFLADLAACLVGMKFRRFLYGDRSMEGTLANFLVGAMVGLYFVGWVAIPVAAVIAVFDFINGGFGFDLNDNLLFPLIAASLLKVLLV